MDVMIALDAEELSSGAEFTIEADQTELVVLTREDRPDEGLDHKRNSCISSPCFAPSSSAYPRPPPTDLPSTYWRRART